ncbi:hypothetical protein MPEAHAMD_5998 [Methylobacterium frigidaeris]|uniref:Uncharacterized protein n=1 Tax=Methylobacterium frigidaeris TaxID=2038277 RepID=A0AA37HGT4_9HYPH|nr:hypothetical protein MPEAHAMD_5998 [Methylobacterium frigidaeris]
MRYKPLPLAEIARFNHRRNADLARLAAGWMPSDDDLAGAPTLSNWIEYMPRGETRPFLMRHLKGHPRQIDGWTQTEQVLAKGDGWVRLHHTWLRLGPPDAAPVGAEAEAGRGRAGAGGS